MRGTWARLSVREASGPCTPPGLGLGADSRGHSAAEPRVGFLTEPPTRSGGLAPLSAGFPARCSRNPRHSA